MYSYKLVSSRIGICTTVFICWYLGSCVLRTKKVLNGSVGSLWFSLVQYSKTAKYFCSENWLFSANPGENILFSLGSMRFNEPRAIFLVSTSTRRNLTKFVGWPPEMCRSYEVFTGVHEACSPFTRGLFCPLREQKKSSCTHLLFMCSPGTNLQIFYVM
jgi:hypothetical protein